MVSLNDSVVFSWLIKKKYRATLQVLARNCGKYLPLYYFFLCVESFSFVESDKIKLSKSSLLMQAVLMALSHVKRVLVSHPPSHIIRNDVEVMAHWLRARTSPILYASLQILHFGPLLHGCFSKAP